MSSPLKYFALTVFSLCGAGAGILAAVFGHPAWAAVLIVVTVLIAAGVVIFDQ